MTSDVVIFGAGGHARVLIDALLAAQPDFSAVILTPDRNLWGQDIYGVPVVGDDTILPELIERMKLTLFVVGVGSIGDTTLRRKLYETGVSHGLHPQSVIHPQAIISTRATLGDGVQLMANSVINAGTRIGSNVIVNTGAVVEHDCRLEDHAHVSPNATVLGGVTIGRGAHIGAGAVLRQSLTIGAGAIVGAGAAVVKDVEPETVVAGVPARILRRLHA